MKSEKRNSFKFYLFLIITVLLMGIVFFFSSQPAPVSDKSSDSLVELLEKILGMTFSKGALDIVVFLVRKSAHFSEYLLLGLFLSLTIKEKRTFLGKELALATIICTLYAVSDEIHQHFVPGRSCELRDICIDAAGAFLGCFLVWAILRKRRKKA